MNHIEVFLGYGRAAYEPGSRVDGTTCVVDNGGIKTIDVRLIWFTRGAGAPDRKVVQSLRLDRVASGEMRQFSFLLPPAPHSFNGRLISLVWAVEAIAVPGGDCARAEFVMAPQGKPIALP